MDSYIISPALIVPRGQQFLVFGGEDLIATCSTREEADWYVEIWGQHQEEFRKILKATFYKHNVTGYRMCPMYMEENKVWRCRQIDHGGLITYPVYTEYAIDNEFTALTFPKA